MTHVVGPIFAKYASSSELEKKTVLTEIFSDAFTLLLSNLLLNLGILESGHNCLHHDISLSIKVTFTMN